jgi:hypothetical protein
MRKSYFDPYDLEHIEKAKQLITKVYEYHYGDSKMRGEVRRLETIIAKIDFLLNPLTNTPK